MKILCVTFEANETTNLQEIETTFHEPSAKLFLRLHITEAMYNEFLALQCQLSYDLNDRIQFYDRIV